MCRSLPGLRHLRLSRRENADRPRARVRVLPAAAFVRRHRRGNGRLYGSHGGNADGYDGARVRRAFRRRYGGGGLVHSFVHGDLSRRRAAVSDADGEFPVTPAKNGLQTGERLL